MDVLDCLKKYGQRLDGEIAEELGLPLATVRIRLAGLAKTGQVITCLLTRFDKGNPVQSWLCRLSGYSPPKAVGRKPAVG